MNSIRIMGLSLLILGSATTLWGQDCTASLKGKIVDKDTHEPLPSVKVEIIDTDFVTYTDLEGQYSLSNICEGKYELKADEPNSQEQIIPILIEGNIEQNLFLDHHHERLEEVLITGRKVVRKSPTAQEQSINEEAIDKFSSASLGDALKQMSGVSTLNTGKSIVKPVIQGLSSSRVPILNNGIQMEDQEWGSEHAPNIDLNSSGKLTVVKGAAALQYGGAAIGGVVIADKPNIPKKDTIYGKTILSGETNGRGGSVSSSLTKAFHSGWYVNLQGTYKKFGDYKAPDYILSNTATNERDFTVNFGLNRTHFGFDAFYSKYNNHLGILRASSTGSMADLVKAINSDKPLYTRKFTYDLEAPRQKVDHQLARLQTYFYFDGLGKLELNYGYQENNRLEYDIRRGENKDKASVDLNLKTHSLQANFDFNTRNYYGVNIGVVGKYKDNFSNPETGVQRLIPDYKSIDLGAYATGYYQWNENWLTEAGVRYDFSQINAKKYYNKTRWNEQGYDEDFVDILIPGDFGSQYLANPHLKFQNWSATLGGKYKLSQKYDIRFNYAMSNRAPNPSELFSDGLHHSAASLEIGELRLQSEHSHKIGLSLEKEQGRWNFNLSPYLNYIQNFIHTSPTGLEETVRGAFLRYEYQQADARLIGVDFDMAYQISSHFDYQGKFAMVDGRETKSGRALVDIPATNMFHQITYSYPKWHDLQLSVNGETTFRKQRYPNDNFEVKVLNDGIYENTLVDISTPPSAYFLLGFDAMATFHTHKNQAIQVRLAFDNLLNTAYRDYLNRLRYYADNTGRNISLQLKFTY